MLKQCCQRYNNRCLISLSVHGIKDSAKMMGKNIKVNKTTKNHDKHKHLHY